MSHSFQPTRGCLLPLNCLAVHPHGSLKFCLTNNLPGRSLNSDFDNERLEIHQQLLSGDWPSSCRSCQKKESQGVQSRRTRTWERKSTRYGLDKIQEDLISQTQSKILHLEITFSNLCNLQCAMCSSEFSTSWIKHDQQALAEGLSFRKFTEPFHQAKRLSEEIIHQIADQISDTELIIVKGGEPTREPLLFKFLDLIKTKNRHPGLLLFIQTNGTRHFSEWESSVDGFQFEIGVSLDGWSEINDWIRTTKFDEILDHLQYLNDSPRVKNISIDFTLTLFNVFHLPEFLQKISNLARKIPKLITCPVFQWAQQYYASPLAIPLDDRIQIVNKILPILEANKDLFLNWENLVEVLKLPQFDEEKVQQAVRWTNHLNHLRKQSIYDLQPELGKSLKAVQT